MIGFPPAGGWVVLNSIIRLTPNPTAKGNIIYKGRGTKYKKNIPTTDVRRCPKKIFLGCANGLSGYPYKRTIDDPKEAIMKIPNSVLYVKRVKIPIVNIEKIPAINDCLRTPIKLIWYNFLNCFERQ